MIRHRYVTRASATFAAALLGAGMAALAGTATAHAQDAGTTAQDAGTTAQDAGTTARGAAGPTATSADEQRMRAQIPLVQAATAVKKALGRTPGGGFAGLGLTGDHVSLWWKGTVPARVTDAVDRASRIAPVTVVPAAHSRAELAGAARRVHRALGAGDSTEVKLNADGSGLVMSVDQAARTTPRAPSVGVPVRVVREARQVARSRDDDTPLWHGGTIMWHESSPNIYTACTAGFGVRYPTGKTFLLTAAHCGDVGSAWQDGSGDAIGTMTTRNAQHDDALIQTLFAGPTVYTGGIADEVQSVVSGWTEVFPGMLLCQSGRSMAAATGGPRCNLEVAYFYPDDPVDGGLVEAKQLDGLDAAYSGDSGGPVYALAPDGSILAAGIVNRTLGPGLGFQDFDTAVTDFGIQPLTGTVGACHVDYLVTNAQNGQFSANVTIHNNGAPITDGWNLGFTFSTPGHQEIATIWQADRTQTGERVTVTNAAYNASIPTGGTATFGFIANGDKAVPGLFTLNGKYCT